MVLGIRRACRSEDDGAGHLGPCGMEHAGCFGQRGAGGQDVVDDDAAEPRHPCVPPPSDPHGAAHALRPGAAAQAFLAARQLQDGPAGLGEDICDGQPAKLLRRPAQQQVDRAEATVQVGLGAGGHGDEADLSGALSGCADCPSERAAEASFELLLAVPLERKQRLGEFFPVDAGSNDRKQHQPVHIHECRRTAFCPERGCGEAPDAAVARDAERPVFRPAADAVNRNSKRQEVRRRSRQPVREPKEGAAVA